MPVCRQCGKQNPEGTVFCGYCAATLASPAKPPVAPLPKPPLAPPPNPSTGAPAKPPPEPTASILKHEVKPQAAPAKVFKPESRLQPGRAQTPPPPPPPAEVKAKGGGSIEWLPWGDLSVGQRAGRAAAGVVVLILIFFFLRGMLRGVASSNQSVSDQQGSGVAMSDSDRRDGIESLCKVFQIYGIPKNPQDASGAAKNAAELFKLAGNQSPERSTFILTAIAEEFRAGKLQGNDCAQAGAPISTAGAANAGGPDGRAAPDAGPTR